ncbi:hypothetical protein Tco_0226847 [Tanacetum coccineum]
MKTHGPIRRIQVSSYAVSKINLRNILEYYNRSPHSKKLQYAALLGIQRLLSNVGVTAAQAQAQVNITQLKLILLSSNSEVSTDSNCSSSCLENVKIIKEKNEQLLKDLRTSKINAITYKIGLESVEARLLVYKKNEVVYEEDIKVLKCEIHLRDVAIIELRRKLELAQKQKDEIQLTVETF